MPNVFDFALMILQSNPNIANSPIGKNFAEACRNRDSSMGEEIANNILASQGLSKDEALDQIKQKGMPNLPNFPFFR